MIPHYPLYINGEFRDISTRADVTNPSTGEPIASVCVASGAEVDYALSSAREAADNGPWRKFSLAQRSEYLRAISSGILDNAAELARLETLNTGKPIKESTFMDIPSAAKTFEHAADRLQEYLAPVSLGIEPVASADLLYEPHGVVALIVPWNYPLLITAWKLASALASGNTVIIKPSSLTPLTALELGRIIHAAGVPKGVVNIINADGGAVGKQLCSDKRVDMVSFTGSNEVGRHILGYTGSHVKKLIMELGGKSASIVMPDADLELAVNGSLCSIFLNQGQMCTAMSRILIHESVYERFIADFVAKASRIKLGRGDDFQTQMGPLISRQQRQRVMNFVDKAISEGGRVLCGGNIPEDKDLENGYFFEPTVIDRVTAQMAIFQEEVFGPVACLSSFSTVDQALFWADETAYGLAGAVWSKDLAQAKMIAARMNTGIVWINTYGMFFDGLPYGGCKQSGFGKELGEEGMKEYCRLKTVITDTTHGAKPLVNYWYGF
jgi:betaine-aldehyde dehydrogenase